MLFKMERTAHGQFRDREGFLFLPRFVNSYERGIATRTVEVRWLERAKWSERYVSFFNGPFGMWVTCNWRDVGMYADDYKPKSEYYAEDQ